jgi:hypothetical protein
MRASHGRPAARLFRYIVAAGIASAATADARLADAAALSDIVAQTALLCEPRLLRGPKRAIAQSGVDGLLVDMRFGRPISPARRQKAAKTGRRSTRSSRSR